MNVIRRTSTAGRKPRGRVKDIPLRQLPEHDRIEQEIRLDRVTTALVDKGLNYEAAQERAIKACGFVELWAEDGALELAVQRFVTE